jgi:hypothetical protein
LRFGIEYLLNIAQVIVAKIINCTYETQTFISFFFMGWNLEGGGGTTIVPRSQCDSIASPAALDAAAGASTLPLTVLPAFLAPLATWAHVGLDHSFSLSRMLLSAAMMGHVAFSVNFPSPVLGLVSALILHFPSFNSGLILV